MIFLRRVMLMGVSTRPAPSLPLLAFGFLLTGVSIALLGPILPLLSAERHLTDAGVGLLPFAQFLGSCLGGATVQARPHRSFVIGLFAAGVGFGLFAVLPTLPLIMAALFLGAWGGGQCIVSINLVASNRYAANRGSAVTALNFIFSGGALLSPLLAAWLTPHIALTKLLLGFAALFIVTALYCVFEFRTMQVESPVASQGEAGAGAAHGLFLFYCLLLVLYGAFETTLSVWLTTYMLRYGQRTLAESQSLTSVFWISLTASRAVASAVLLKVREKLVQRLSVACVVLATTALIFAHSAAAIVVCVLLVGASLGPVFPVTFAIFLGRKPTARQAGIVIAVSGIGAAVLPWLVGVVSRQTGSLQTAFLLPLTAIAVYLGLTFTRRSA